jgi:D-glycero-beta-D-manno-heptose-7-phosphate kinase
VHVKDLVEVIPTLKIMVVGDVILDEYLWGTVQHISPEAPVPIVEVRNRTYELGGAGNVAANLANLGISVWVTGVVGTDPQANNISELFQRIHNISPNFYPCNERPTTTKTRIIAQSQQILRIDQEARSQISPEAETYIINWVREQLQGFHACILSDYAKGVLTENLINSLITICRKFNVPIIIDPKGYNYNKYRGATVITPNIMEANLAARNEDGTLTLEEVVDRLRAAIGGGAILITQDVQGMTLYTNNSIPIHILANVKQAHTVTGAGDTVVAVLALSLAAGLDLETSAKLANYAAGLVVGKADRVYVSLEELCAFFQATPFPSQTTSNTSPSTY